MFFFEGEHIDTVFLYSCINSDKIRTSPQPGPRNAWIGNPHQQNCMVEVGTRKYETKVHP
jgi:hypothetical protein